MRNRAARLRTRLGGEPCHLCDPLPDKPKGMHQETYERLTYMILAFEAEVVELLQDNFELHKEKYYGLFPTGQSFQVDY